MNKEGSKSQAKNNLLNKQQHGFRKGRSCLTHLLDHYEYILSQLEDGKMWTLCILTLRKHLTKSTMEYSVTNLKRWELLENLAYRYITSCTTDNKP